MSTRRCIKHRPRWQGFIRVREEAGGKEVIVTHVCERCGEEFDLRYITPNHHPYRIPDDLVEIREGVTITQECKSCHAEWRIPREEQVGTCPICGSIVGCTIKKLKPAKDRKFYFRVLECGDCRYWSLQTIHKDIRRYKPKCPSCGKETEVREIGND